MSIMYANTFAHIRDHVQRFYGNCQTLLDITKSLEFVQTWQRESLKRKKH